MNGITHSQKYLIIFRLPVTFTGHASDEGDDKIHPFLWTLGKETCTFILRRQARDLGNTYVLERSSDKSPHYSCVCMGSGLVTDTCSAHVVFNLGPEPPSQEDAIPLLRT